MTQHRIAVGERGEHREVALRQLYGALLADPAVERIRIGTVGRIEHLRRELSSSIEASHELERLVRLDTLTGIANRRMFEEGLWREWRRAERDRGRIVGAPTARVRGLPRSCPRPAIIDGSDHGLVHLGDHIVCCRRPEFCVSPSPPSCW